MSDGPTGDPIFLEQPQPVGAPPAKPEHERKKEHPTDAWVVLDHVSGEGARSRLEAQHRQLEHAGITARIEHDHDGKIALEVLRDQEHKALEVIGRKHAHGAGTSAHETHEEQIEAEEKGALKGVFKLTTMVWFVVAVAVIFGVWYLFAFGLGFFR